MNPGAEAKEEDDKGGSGWPADGDGETEEEEEQVCGYYNRISNP